jgi:hypothetical protein
MSLRHWLGYLGITAIVTSAIVFGQSPAGSPATLDALLAEVRSLHADVNQAGGTSIRTQLLVARLQLQEQRINTIAKQLNDVQTQRIALDSGTAQMDAHLKQLEDRERNPATTPEVRKQIESERVGMKPALDQITSHRQQLVNQESAFASQLSVEQSRWSDFNERLDQIEREIAGRR